MKPIRIMSFKLALISSSLYIIVSSSPVLNLEGASPQELQDDKCAVDEFLADIDTCTTQRMPVDILPYVNADGTISNIGACCTLTKMKHCFSYYVKLKCENNASEDVIDEIFRLFVEQKPLESFGVTDLSCVVVTGYRSEYEYDSDTCVNARDEYVFNPIPGKADAIPSQEIEDDLPSQGNDDKDVTHVESGPSVNDRPSKSLYHHIIPTGIAVFAIILLLKLLWCIGKQCTAKDEAPGGSQYVEKVAHPYQTL